MPRNFAEGPGLVSINLRVGKSLTLGETACEAKSDPKSVVYADIFETYMDAA